MTNKIDKKLSPGSDKKYSREFGVYEKIEKIKANTNETIRSRNAITIKN